MTESESLESTPRMADRLLNVSELPTYAFGSRSLLWWATLGLLLIEGTAFAIVIAAYFYIRTRFNHWPPDEFPPDLKYGSINTLVLLASLLPNEWVKRAAEKKHLPTVRIGLLICIAFAVAFTVIRIFEFGGLNCEWNGNAYGSVVWMLMGLHTTHLVTDLFDTIVLTILMFVGPIEDKRFVDVSENQFYWYFVVLAWLPIYVVIYWLPRGLL